MPSPLERLTGRRAAGRSAPAAGKTPFEHVQQLSWPGEPPRKRFLPMLRRALEDQPDPRVALVAGPQLATWIELFSRAWPGLEPVAVDHRDDPSAVHVRLALAGPYDVVVHAADGSALEQARVFPRVFFHVREGGTYLTPALLALGDEDAAAARSAAAAWLQQETGRRALPNEDGALVPPYVGELWDLVAEAERARLHAPVEILDLASRQRDVVGLGRHLLDVEVRGVSLRIVNGRRTDVKLTEQEAGPVLAARPDLGRVVATIPATRLHARAEYRHNLERDGYVRSEMDVPELALREYHAPALSRGQVVTSGGFVWPDTYRHPLAPRLHNRYVDDPAPRFGRLRRSLAEADELPGAWFNLDSEWPGHYGHMLTELLGRMWAWDQVRQAAPGVQCLMTLPPDRMPQRLAPFEVHLLSAFGITPDDVHVFERPCVPAALYSATSMFSLPDYVHPDMVRVWDRVGDHLAAQATDGPRSRRIFCSRPTGYKRSCTNSAEVEALFVRHGFEVVRPETLPLPDQVAMFRNAEAIGGFGGSALFTSALCETPKTVFTVAPTAYTARNEHLIAAARGHTIVSAWSEPRLHHPDGGWTQQAYASEFTFDLRAEGAWLDDQLAELG